MKETTQFYCSVCRKMKDITHKHKRVFTLSHGWINADYEDKGILLSRHRRQ